MQNFRKHSSHIQLFLKILHKIHLKTSKKTNLFSKHIFKKLFSVKNLFSIIEQKTIFMNSF